MWHGTSGLDGGRVTRFLLKLFGIPEREKSMIEVTKMNGTKVLINSDLIEMVEETPDTVLSFTTGRKIIVKESRQEIKSLVKSYKRDIMTTNFETG